MKKIKKAIKVLAFVCLLILAGIGVGVSGGAIIPFSKTRRDAEKENTELIEKENKKSGSEEEQIKG